MDSNYRIAYQKGWEDLKHKDPLSLKSRLSLSYSDDTGNYLVPFFNDDYVVDPVHETIHRQKDGQRPNTTASIIILHYLTYSVATPPLAHQWVSLKEIPGGGALFYPAFHTNSILPLIRTFGHDSSLLSHCAPALGGKSLQMGSAAALFHAFPEIPLAVVIWEGDEEVPANGTVLFDPSIAQLLHIETLIGLGMYLVSRLVELAQN